MAAPAMQRTRNGAYRRTMRQPNHGVYMNKNSVDIDRRGLEDCLNVRIRDGKVLSDGLGWENFPLFASNTDRINLDDRGVLYIDQYRSRSGSTTAIFCNQKDIFRFNSSAGPPATVTYMTPIYATGTMEMAGGGSTTVIGTGTAWDTAKDTLPVAGGYGKNVKAGNYISFNAADEDALDATWYEIDSVTDDTHLEIFEAPGITSPGTDYTIRQTMTGDNSDLFESDTFKHSQDARHSNKDVYYLTNGVEMFSWDGAAATFLRFWPGFTGKNLIVHKQVLAIWNLIVSGSPKPGSIRWSELNHPDNLTDNGAGETLPSDGVLDLLEVIPIGDQLACYFQGDIILMQYVGAPLYFIARVAIPGVGLVAQRAMMDFGDYHEFLSRDGAYRFDGVTIMEAMPQVFREVLRKVAPNRIKMAYAVIDEENGEVIWSVPLTTDGGGDFVPPVMGYSEHYLEDVGPNLPTPMTIREYPFTAVGFYQALDSAQLKFKDFEFEAFEDSALKWDDASFGSAFPFKIAGDVNGDIYILNTSNTQNGVGVNSFARFPRFPLFDGEFKGVVLNVEPHTSRRSSAQDYELDIRLYSNDFADGGSDFVYEESFDLTHSGLRYVPFRSAARYAALMFTTNGGSTQDPIPEPWDLSGYSMKIVPAGGR